MNSLRREVLRKAFHLGGLIYFTGFIFLPPYGFMAILLGLLLTSLVIEWVRLRVPVFNEWLFFNFGFLFREKERNRFSGVFWMLLGLTLTIAVAGVSSIATAVFLYLIIGDALASLVGKSFGGPHWGKSDKRLAGSAACFVACVVIGIIVLKPYFGWSSVFVGALAATVFELGLIPFDDNFTIPFGSALVLMAFYGPTPAVLEKIQWTTKNLFN